MQQWVANLSDNYFYHDDDDGIRFLHIDVVHGNDFGDFGDLVGAGLADSLLLVECQIVVERKDLLMEKVVRDDLGYIQEILGDGDADR